LPGPVSRYRSAIEVDIGFLIAKHAA
jgi:hypothetical protein